MTARPNVTDVPRQRCSRSVCSSDRTSLCHCLHPLRRLTLPKCCLFPGPRENFHLQSLPPNTGASRTRRSRVGLSFPGRTHGQLLQTCSHGGYKEGRGSISGNKAFAQERHCRRDTWLVDTAPPLGTSCCRRGPMRALHRQRSGEDCGPPRAFLRLWTHSSLLGNCSRKPCIVPCGCEARGFKAHVRHPPYTTHMQQCPSVF